MTGLTSVLLDCSFCIHLLKEDAEHHQNAKGLFQILFGARN